MNSFSVNLSTVFTEFPFLERFKKAREAGFDFVECQFPYDCSIEEIKKELNDNHLSLVLINLYPGNWANGDRGLAIDPARVDEFKESLERGIDYALSLKAKNIHCMAGILSPEIERDLAKRIYIENIRYAAEKMAQHDITLLIEPINPYDMPGYFLDNIHEAAEIIKDINLPNVKIQYDFYHIQRIQGDLLSTFQQYIEMIGHVQIADAPGRHQPGTGEIHYKNIFEDIEKLGYRGLIGLEYTPKGRSEESFKWLNDLYEGGTQA